jgi:hypothetical protein
MLPINPLGCPGVLFCSPSGSCAILICSIMNYIFLAPIIVVITIIMACFLSGALQIEMNQKCGLDRYFWDYSGFFGRLWMCLVCFIEGSIMMPIAIALAIAACALTIIPMYIVQTYRLFKIFALQCCKTNDKKKPKKNLATASN